MVYFRAAYGTFQVWYSFVFYPERYLVISKSRTIGENWQTTKKEFLSRYSFFPFWICFTNNIVSRYTRETFLCFGKNSLSIFRDFPILLCGFSVCLFFMYLLNPIWQNIFSDEKTKSTALYITKISFVFSIFVTIIKFPCLRQGNFFNSFTLWLGYLPLYFYGGLLKNKWIDYKNKWLNISMICVGLIGIIGGDYYTAYAKIHSLRFVWSGYFLSI
jgi:hypothetical protein